jgi:hypothetical protein
MSLTTVNFQLAFVLPKFRWRSFVQGYALGGEGSCARMRFKQQYIHNHSDLDTCSYEFFYSQWPLLSPPKVLTFPPESPYILL